MPGSEALRRRASEIIPGGCHTYAKGNDQYPAVAPPFIRRGNGCHVWDLDGNEFIEFGMGLRSVALGHGFRPVIEAACRAMQDGLNFVRPSPLGVECAEELLSVVTGAEMVKFAKNGSDATTAAVKLARAFTERDLVAICGDQPFFSTDDWFIGVTPMAAGIPRATRDLTVTFRYNDLDSLQALFDRYPSRVACVVLEAASAAGEPDPGYLPALREACHTAGALLIFDEMITGFRWDVGGAQAVYGVTPDLSTFGKAMGNGFPISALVGLGEVMRLGGLDHHRERVFLLSTTHGAEAASLAAAMATMRFYREHGVIEVLYRQGERLRAGIGAHVENLGLTDHFQILGRASNLVFATRDAGGKRSQEFRTLFMQELVRRGILAPSFVVSYSHSDADIDRTVEAAGEALEVYRKALADGVGRYLVGPSVKPVFRTHND